MNDELSYKEIVEKYKNGDLGFSIELSKARKFLMQNTIYTNKLYFWTFLNFGLFPISILIFSIIELGFWGGIAYGIVALISAFCINGTASINISQAITTTTICAGIGLLLKFFEHLNMNYCLFITIIQCISMSCFYRYIGKIIIDKILLVDKKWFYRLYGDIFYVYNYSFNKNYKYQEELKDEELKKQDDIENQNLENFINLYEKSKK